MAEKAIPLTFLVGPIILSLKISLNLYFPLSSLSYRPSLGGDVCLFWHLPRFDQVQVDDSSGLVGLRATSLQVVAHYGSSQSASQTNELLLLF